VGGLGRSGTSSDPERSSDSVDEAHMLRAVTLADRGRGRVEPNPRVGAVVAMGERVVAEGYHRDYGGPHAEAVALAKAGRRARGATLYVTLEPCSTTGKTPPCAEAVEKSGVRRVVVGRLDPNPRNRGGADRLRARGLDVVTGVLAEACDGLLDPFRAHLAGTLPFVTVKWAMTLDGQVATRTGASRWITSTAARREGHRERARSDAIVVGIGTVLADDPSLDTRHVRGRSPVRIVVDSRLRLPLGSRLVRDAARVPVVVLTTGGAPATRCAALEFANDRIRVNSIAPGGISTPILFGINGGDQAQVEANLERFQPYPRAGQPQDIANAALFLASDASEFITGHTLVVDGGATAGPRMAVPKPGRKRRNRFAGPSFEGPPR